MKAAILFLSFILFGISGYTQDIQITATYTSDTTGLPPDLLPAMEQRIDVSFSSTLIAGSTFRIGLGMETGEETIFKHDFDTGQTGITEDGSGVEVSGGHINVCLGTFTGLESFHLTLTPTSGGSDGTPVNAQFAQ
jgi:hypothetical protein